MSLTTYVFGVDPGPTTGIASISLAGGRIMNTNLLLQCTHGWACSLVGYLAASAQPSRCVLAVERFVVGPRAARSATPMAGQITRDLIGALEAIASLEGAEVVMRSASQVKPWATDARLKAAGLDVKGMPHAKDAARHALYAAVRDCNLPDPLSRSPRGDL